MEIRLWHPACGSSLSLSSYLILADDAAEDGSSTDARCIQVDDGADWLVGVVVGNALVDALAWPLGVVVSHELGQGGAQVRLVGDQDSVGQFAAQGPDQALADRVRPGRLRRALEDPQAAVLEHGVELLGELPDAVTDEDRISSRRAHAHGEVAGLLCGPRAVGVCRDPGNVQPPGSMLGEHQYVDAPQQHGVRVEEVCCDRGAGLGCQEPLLGWPAALRRRVDPCRSQDLSVGLE